MRIGGISSGMDTEGIIEQLLALERRPLVQLAEQKSRIQRRTDAWRDINSRLANLERQLGSLKLESTFLSRDASSSSDSVAKASATIEATPGTYQVMVEHLAQSHRVGSDHFQGAFESSGSFLINGQEIMVVEGETLQDLQHRINSAEELDVHAKIVDHRLILESTKTGEANRLQMEDVDGGVLDMLGIVSGEGVPVFKHEIQAARNSLVYIEGIVVERESNTLEDVVQGVSIFLKGQGSSQISVAHNTNEAIDRVKAFVNQFNSTMDFIQNAQHRNEETGATGNLFGDAGVRQLQFSLRNNVTSPVKDVSGVNLSFQLGIEIGRDGKMTFDESKFREAMNDDPHQIHRFFSAESEDGEPLGMARRVESFIQSYTRSDDGIVALRRDSYSRQMKDIDRRVELVERRVEMRERTLVRQFAAMEQALGTMYNQGDWLQQQILSLSALNNQRRK